VVACESPLPKIANDYAAERAVALAGDDEMFGLNRVRAACASHRARNQ
jgi:hypothetical protein